MQSVERAFRVLRALAAAEGRAGVSGVARTTGLPKSTVSRLLAALESVGVIDRLGDAYSIGPGMAALAGAGSPTGSLWHVGRPYLRDLVTSLGESAGITVPDGGSALYIDHVPAAGSIQTRDWTGSRFPYHTIAGGLAIMMTWADHEIATYAAQGLAAFTSHTVTTVEALMQRVEDARRAGYAWTLGDFDDEINGVAAPVRPASGGAIAAVTVYGPSYRFPQPGHEDAAGQAVAEVAAVVEAHINAI